MKKRLILFTAFSILLMGSCRKDYDYITPPPQATSQLIAKFESAPPSALTSPYWANADYLKINASDLSKSQLYGDGLFNMTGTFSGLSSFNNGTGPDLTLKAAYDNDNLYILAQWTNQQIHLSDRSWFFGGPADPLKSGGNTTGWTSQLNSDKIALAFEIQSAYSSSGTFANTGCAATCHIGSNPSMQPDAGMVDFWNWSASRCALGYAEDMVAKNGYFGDDNGDPIFMRNSAGGDRSGPAYEWNGSPQNITLKNGRTVILDPAFYIYNKTAFLGNATTGDSIYHSTILPGGCNGCHGNKGEGADGPALANVYYNNMTWNQINNDGHSTDDMCDSAGWHLLTKDNKDNLIAYLRGLAGYPGIYLTVPSGSNADITVITNITPADIKNAYQDSTNKPKKYQVLFIRKLNTGNSDDVQFNLSQTKQYPFGVALMNNDGKNHIGSMLETLIFK